MSIDSVRLYCTIGIVVGALVIIALERLFPYNKNQKLFRAGFVDDFFLYNFMQTYVLGVVISYIITFIDSRTEVSRLQFLRDWPVWLQLLLFLVAHDFYIYWFHRWQHNSRILWRIHEAHHSTADVDWLSGIRSHALEILINQTVEFLPMVLLGAPPEIPIYKGLISAVWGMYIHSNIDVRTGKLQYILNGPEMHRWHHADGDEQAYDKNFSTKLAIWDWLFGTAFFPKDRKAEKYGLSYSFPPDYFRQQAFAFRKFEKE